MNPLIHSRWRAFFLFLLLLFVNLQSGLASELGTAQSKGLTGDGTSELYKEVQQPFRIDNDSEFEGLASSYGWKGDGSESNPWVIEGLDINGSESGLCIYIGNTTDDFIVKNCSLHHASRNLSSKNTALTLFNVSKGSIVNNDIWNNGRGLDMISSKDLTIRNNSIRNSHKLTEPFPGAPPSGMKIYSDGNEKWISTRHRSGTVFMGGGAEPDEAMHWLTDRSDEGDFVVIRTDDSSGYQDYIYNQIGGVDSCHTLVVDKRQYANSSFVEQVVRNAEVLWIAGGNQTEYYQMWNDTGLERAVEYLSNEKRAAVGGTSAGMAILGEIDYIPEKLGIRSSEVLSDPYHEFMESRRDDFLDDIPFSGNTLMDTHWSERNRSGRTIAFMARNIVDNYSVYEETRAIACDESTAVCVNSSGVGRIFGWEDYMDHAYFMKADSPPDRCVANESLNWKDAVSVYKVRGWPNGSNTFDLSSWTGFGGKWRDVNVTNGSLDKDIQEPGMTDRGGNDDGELKAVKKDIETLENGLGVALNDTTYSSIHNNSLSCNLRGIQIKNSSNNTIFHNNFYNNTEGAFDDGCNLWNKAYPQGGNYWSSFDGADEFSGSGQDIDGRDGFFDSRKDIIGGNKSDSYPLVEPFDGKSPVIKDIKVDQIGMTNATIRWRTDDLSDSRVCISRYGDMKNSTKVQSDELVYEHRIQLNNLDVNTTYHFEVGSTDIWGESTTVTNDSNHYEFTTMPDSKEPEIYSVQVKDVGERSATVSWKTDEPSDGMVVYSLEGDLSSDHTAVNTSLTEEHLVDLSNLTPNTIYHFKVVSTDENGNEAESLNGSEPYSFKTARRDYIFIEDLTSKNGTTGDKFTFEARVSAKNAISKSYIIYWYGSGREFRANMTQRSDRWMTNISLAPNKSTLHYRVYAIDSKESLNSTEMSDVSIIDDDRPFIKLLSASDATTGDTFTVRIEGRDNMGLKSMKVSYWVDETVTTESISQVRSHVWKLNITLPSSITGKLRYQITAEDGSGNTASTNIMEESVVDNDKPVPVIGCDSEGGEIVLNGDCSYDNTKVVNYTWTITKDGIILSKVHGESYNYTIKEGGNYYISLNVTDVEGNWQVSRKTVHAAPAGSGGSDKTEDPAGVPWRLLLLVITVISIITGAVYLIKNSY